MFKYYLEVEYEEHMLYANEISGIYSEACGVSLTTAKVVAILNKYAKNNGIEIPRLYYHTKWGLKRVYQEALYKPAMEEYVKTVQLGG
jgi:hypothetical protein